MKNKLTDLNDHLFAQLERLSDEALTQEGLEKEIQRTDSIVSVSEQIINNAQLAINAAELVAKHGRGNWEDMLPMVEGKPRPPGIERKPKAKGVPDYADN